MCDLDVCYDNTHCLLAVMSDVANRKFMLTKVVVKSALLGCLLFL